MIDANVFLHLTEPFGKLLKVLSKMRIWHSVIDRIAVNIS